MDLPVASTNPTEAYKKALEVLGLFFGQRTETRHHLLESRGIFGPLYHSMANLPSRLCHAAVKGGQPDLATCAAARPNGAKAATILRQGLRGRYPDGAHHTAPQRAHLQPGQRARHHTERVAGRRPQGRPEFDVELAPGGDEAPTFMDLSRISADVGYQPKIGIERGIADYISWVRTHPR